MQLSEKALEIYQKASEIFAKYRTGSKHSDDPVDMASDAMKLTHLKIEFVPILHYFEEAHLLSAAKIKASEAVFYVSAREELVGQFLNSDKAIKPTEAYISAKSEINMSEVRQDDARILADLKSVRYLWEAITDSINILKARLKTDTVGLV